MTLYGTNSAASTASLHCGKKEATFGTASRMLKIAATIVNGISAIKPLAMERRNLLLDNTSATGDKT